MIESTTEYAEGLLAIMARLNLVNIAEALDFAIKAGLAVATALNKKGSCELTCDGGCCSVKIINSSTEKCEMH